MSNIRIGAGTETAPGLLSATTQTTSGNKTLKGTSNVQSGSLSLTVGADASATTLTNATNKIARISVPHYTNSEEPMAVVFGQTTSSETQVNIGGGSSLQNAATTVNIFAAANNTTTSGTNIASFTTAGAAFPAGLTVFGGSVLSFYTEYSFSMAVAGPFNSQSFTFKATRIGNTVTLKWPQVLASGNSTAAPFTITATNFPTAIRPTNNMQLPVFVRDNGSQIALPGCLIINAAGNHTIQLTYATTNFASTASTCGMEAGSVTYNVL